MGLCMWFFDLVCIGCVEGLSCCGMGEVELQSCGVEDCMLIESLCELGEEMLPGGSADGVTVDGEIGRGSGAGEIMEMIFGE